MIDREQHAVFVDDRVALGLSQRVEGLPHATERVARRGLADHDPQRTGELIPEIRQPRAERVVGIGRAWHERRRRPGTQERDHRVRIGLREPAARDGDIGLIKGLYALCPYIAGQWPLPQNPSSTENNGILLDLHNNRGAMSYGIEELKKRNPLAWPGFASADDVKGLPPVVISVNECDPLRDEGINFYRLLMHNGVAARCRQVMGTIHGTEVFPVVCPEISRDTARDIAAFCTS